MWYYFTSIVLGALGNRFWGASRESYKETPRGLLTQFLYKNWVGALLMSIGLTIRLLPLKTFLFFGWSIPTYLLLPIIYGLVIFFRSWSSAGWLDMSLPNPNWEKGIERSCTILPLAGFMFMVDHNLYFFAIGIASVILIPFTYWVANKFTIWHFTEYGELATGGLVGAS